MSDPQHIALMEAVARHFFGEPNRALSKKPGELRFGTHGSKCVDLKRGIWFDHEAGQGGGPLALIKRETGISEARACYEWARRYGCWHCERKQKAAPRKAESDATAQSKKRTDQQHDKAAWLWSRRQPIGGTIAETYLRKARGIICVLPPTLGFLSPYKPEHSPALIAAFALPNEAEPGILASPRNVTTVHLTLLRSDGSGKADLPQPKLMIGSPAALPIVLAPVNDIGGLAITEGIEDALTAHQATRLGAWAACGAGRMPALADAIPHYVEAVTIFSHDDEAGRRAAHGLAENIIAIGNAEVFIEGGPR